jgi:hypothetical protein
LYIQGRFTTTYEKYSLYMETIYGYWSCFIPQTYIYLKKNNITIKTHKKGTELVSSLFLVPFSASI